MPRLQSSSEESSRSHSPLLPRAGARRGRRPKAGAAAAQAVPPVPVVVAAAAVRAEPPFPLLEAVAAARAEPAARAAAWVEPSAPAARRVPWVPAAEQPAAAETPAPAVPSTPEAAAAGARAVPAAAAGTPALAGAVAELAVMAEACQPDRVSGTGSHGDAQAALQALWQQQRHLRGSGLGPGQRRVAVFRHNIHDSRRSVPDPQAYTAQHRIILLTGFRNQRHGHRQRRNRLCLFPQGAGHREARLRRRDTEHGRRQLRREEIQLAQRYCPALGRHHLLHRSRLPARAAPRKPARKGSIA